MESTHLCTDNVNNELLIRSPESHPMATTANMRWTNAKLMHVENNLKLIIHSIIYIFHGHSHQSSPPPSSADAPPPPKQSFK